MNNFWLQTKKALIVCMETTGGGRNYSGGLGALYGDTIRTMDRLDASYMAVTPIYKNGYVSQKVTSDGVIDEYPEQDFNVDYCDTGIVLSIPLLNQTVKAKVWKNRSLKNAYGLDTFLPENGDLAYITNNLYGENGFSNYSGEDQRLMQEVIVGVGSVMLAQEIGFDFEILHLNEGHGVFAALHLISLLKIQGYSFQNALNTVKEMTVFTTHTPIAAGNKTRPISMIMALGANLGLSEDEVRWIGGDESEFNFGSTTAALRVSKFANAVAFSHQSISQKLWGNVDRGCPIIYIDNAVDIDYWQDPEIKKAYEAFSYPDMYAAHNANKRRLIAEVQKRNGVTLDESNIIIGFARRFIEYKQADLIFEDLDRFEALLKNHNVQIIFAGKTHPKDSNGKKILMRIYEMTQRYPNNVVFMQNYDAEIAKLMTQGCDGWLANPEKDQEASGTSGMKSAANGGLNISNPEGWWYRSGRHCVNGWVIGNGEAFNDKHTNAECLYKVLEEHVLPTYMNKDAWVTMMFAAVHMAEDECSAERLAKDYFAYLYNAPYLG